MRYALYYTPGPDHPLTRAAALWLGRDAFTGAALPQPAEGLSAAEMARLTEAPRRYGFHATLVAPFRPARGATRADVLALARDFAACRAGFSLRLSVGRLAEFFALRPPEPGGLIHELACDAVSAFGALRAPLSAEEIARRHPDRLSPRQRFHLERYGYPHVMDDFRCHMTLTGPVAEAEAGRVAAALHDRFDALLAAPLAVDAVTVFAEPEPGAPFTAISSHRFDVAERRKTS